MSIAGRKWLAILFDVLSYEANHTDDDQLLSEYCDRHIERRPILARVVILLIGEAVVLHLANVMPWQYDVISRRFWVGLARLLRSPPLKKIQLDILHK